MDLLAHYAYPELYQLRFYPILHNEEQQLVPFLHESLKDTTQEKIQTISPYYCHPTSWHPGYLIS